MCADIEINKNDNALFCVYTHYALCAHLGGNQPNSKNVHGHYVMAIHYMRT